jgi:hypothetical protein
MVSRKRVDAERHNRIKRNAETKDFLIIFHNIGKGFRRGP